MKQSIFEMQDKTYLYLIALALVSWKLLDMASLDGDGLGIKSPHSPDYFCNGYSKLAMDATGRPATRVLADKLTHYDGQGKTYLDNPVFYSFSGQANPTPPWVIASSTGELSDGGKDLLLQGAVSITREGSTEHQPFQIITTHLKVKPEISLAETDERAELSSAASKTSGTGMKLVFKAPVRLELLSHVQGNYEKK
jgi:lipopolysaccharide export system protein LptC